VLIRFKLTKRDYYYSAFWNFLTSRAIWLAILCVPFGFLVTILQPQSLNKLLLITSFGALFFFCAFAVLVVLSVLKKLKKEADLLHSLQALDLRSDGVFYFPKEGGKGVHSSFIWKILESPWHFYLYLTPKHVILVPKKEVDKKEFKKAAKSLILKFSDLMSLILR